MKIRNTRILLLITILLLILSTCTKTQSSNTEKNPLRSIIASTSIIADVAANICGDKAKIESLIKAGQSPHNYEPGTRDIARLSSASLVFVNGFDLEQGLLELIQNNVTVEIVEVSRGIEPITMIEHHDEEEDSEPYSEHHVHGEFDPHTWTSPLNVMKWCDVIREALETHDPDNRAYYQTQYTAYIKKLQALDDFIRNDLYRVESKIIMITDHRFMEYFARDYGLETPLTISDSFSSNAEPSPQDMANLVNFIKANKIKALFLGNTSDDAMNKLAETIKGELNNKLKIIILLSGSLTPPGLEGSTYLDFMTYNVARIVDSLK
ncbi:MAG: zinc ABC transporter substrate-binding protein [Spirochaetales bacterium]|nr:zinc ABC transporter substrate-binding protein [Spirochaetales bacterium]